MIERKFITQNIKEKLVQNFVAAHLERSGHSKIEIKRTALGEKIIIYTNRPGLIVGRKGENIKRLTLILKKKFDMENPEIEVAEITHPYLDPNSVADNIINTFDRFGPKRFKYIGYDTLSKIMRAGAIGAEILISGRGVPGARAKRWRFSAGYLKKSGNVSETKVLKSLAVANLRSGSVGVQVKIMPPNVKLPDRIILKEIDKEIKVEPVKEEIEQKAEEKPEEKKVVKKQKVKGEDGNTKKKRTKAA